MLKKETEEKSNFRSTFDLPLIILSVAFLVISIAFFWRLNSVTGVGFGLPEISFSIATTLVITAFLIWMRSIIRKNLYLGLSLSLLGLVAGIYAVFLRYKGPNTMVFTIISSIVYLIYVGYIFFKNKGVEKKSKFDEEYDDKV